MKKAESARDDWFRPVAADPGTRFGDEAGSGSDLFLLQRRPTPMPGRDHRATHGEALEPAPASAATQRSRSAGPAQRPARAGSAATKPEGAASPSGQPSCVHCGHAAVDHVEARLCVAVMEGAYRARRGCACRRFEPGDVRARLRAAWQRIANDECGARDACTYPRGHLGPCSDSSGGWRWPDVVRPSVRRRKARAGAAASGGGNDAD